MELIKDLGMKRNKYEIRQRRFGLFLCEYCNKEIEKRIDQGIPQVSCMKCKNKLMKNKNRTHGDSRNGKYIRLYNIWTGMKYRCNNPNNTAYKDYGGRGIRICKQWEKHYIIFNIWALSHGYKDNLTIDRKDNNGNYEPSNCRWITNTEQARNTSRTRLNWLTIRIIRALYKDGYTVNMLFKIFDITLGNLWSIVNNKTWKEEVI